MALASPVTPSTVTPATVTPSAESPAAKPSWNPLRCGGTALPPPVLLMAKLIALCLLLTGHVTLLPQPFLPFLPIFDHMGDPVVFQWVLRVAFVASALALLFNRSVRVSAFVLGATILVGVLSSKIYYGNNKIFCGFILLLTGLQRPGQDPWLLRYQVAIVYFGAGLNKILDPDWRTGQFFEFWAVEVLRNSWYVAAINWFPPMALSWFMGWFTIAAELGLAAGFLARRFYPYAIWGGILLHSGMLLFANSTYTMFFYAMLASFLLFAPWPRSPMLVLYDGDCGFCTQTKDWIARFDFDRMFDWQPLQGGAGLRYRLSDEVLRERLHLIAGAKIYAGFAAFKMMLLYNPLFYFTVATLLTLGGGVRWFRDGLVVALLVFFSPFFAPLGEAAYNWVARNRYRIPAKERCQVG